MAEAAFDSSAQDYDYQFSESATGRAQRALVWDHLDRNLRSTPMRVLELNCGTGEDAAHLAKAGHQVLATDVSAEMVRVAQAKLTEHTQASAKQIAIENLEALEHGSGFDLVFSNFGGLNCVSPSQMEKLGGQLSRFIPVGGHAILVVMPRVCLWEIVWNLLHLSPRAAFRRLQAGPIKARPSPDSPATLDVWYHRKSDYARWLAPAFSLRDVRPIGLAVPPSALEGVAMRFPRLLNLLQSFDRQLPGWPFASMADHMLLDFERKL